MSKANGLFDAEWFAALQKLPRRREAGVSLAKRRTWYADPPPTPPTPTPPVTEGDEKPPTPAPAPPKLPDGAPEWIADPAKAWKEVLKLRKENGDKRVAAKSPTEPVEPPSVDERVASLESELKASKLSSLRLEIAAELGLGGGDPKRMKALAARLHGDNEDELREDAETLLALLPPVPVPTEGEPEDKKKKKTGPVPGVQTQTTTVPGAPAAKETDAQRGARLFGGNNNAFSGGKVVYQGSAEDLDAPLG